MVRDTAPPGGEVIEIHSNVQNVNIQLFIMFTKHFYNIFYLIVIQQYGMHGIKIDPGRK